MTEIEARLRDAKWRQADMVREDWTERLLARCLDNRPAASEGTQRLVIINQIHHTTVKKSSADL